MDFESSVGPYLTELRAYCLRLTASRWDAEDLCQEVLLRTYRHYTERGDIRQMRSFLYTVARRLRIDESRRKRPACIPFDAAIEPCTVELGYVSARAMAEWVTAAVPAREARMLFLAAVFRCSYADIAQEMNTTVPAVRMALVRARSALRADRDKQPALTKRGAGKRPQVCSQATVDAWTYALLQGEPAEQALTV